MTVLNQYLQAEVWRLVEETQGTPHRDLTIEMAARNAGNTFQERVHARAVRFLAINGGAVSLARVGARLRTAFSAVCVLIFVVGLSITRLFPGEDGAAVNLVAVLGALILPNMLSLLLWILASFVGGFSAIIKLAKLGTGMIPTDFREATSRLPVPKSGTNWGQASTSTKSRTATKYTIPIRWAPGWLGAQCAHALQHLPLRSAFAIPAEAQAWTEYLLRTASGRARLACLTHGLWLALLLGSLSGCWSWFAFKQVDFRWGSTVLAESTVEIVLTRLAEPIRLLGITVPSAEEVARSRFGQVSPMPASTRRQWGYFLLAALMLYALLPRALAAGFTWIRLRALEQHLALDETQPGYARLRSLLMAAPSAIVDPDTAPPALASHAPYRTSPAPPVAAAWLAVERESLPIIAPLEYLGVVTDRQTQGHILDIVRANHHWPALVAQVTLITTPDRGLERFLATLASVAQCPLFLQLVDAPEASDWSPKDRAQRIEDWTALAINAGLTPAFILPPA